MAYNSIIIEVNRIHALLDSPRTVERDWYSAVRANLPQTTQTNITRHHDIIGTQIKVR